MAEREPPVSGELEDQVSKGDLSPGASAGQYVVTELIARGGCGSVYRARHSANDELAAVKVLHGSLAVLPKMVERFAREVQVVSMLRHPSIIEIREVGTLTDGRPFFAMEYVRGRTLSGILEEEGRMSPPEVLEVLEPVCAALSAAHEAGIVHRDVKASNIMVLDGDKEGASLRAPAVKLLDFGIAKLIGPQASPMGLTSEGRQVGTLTIMAPEQLLGIQVDARIDVYALGVLLYRLLTGRLPFDGKNALTLAQQHLEEPAPRPSQRIPLAPALDAIVLRCMEKRPERRYDSVKDFLTALRRAIAGAQRRHDTLPPAPMLGLAIYVDLRMRAEGDEIDELLDEDVAVVLDLAEESLRSTGFVLATATGSGVLGVLSLPDGADDQLRARRAAVEVAALLHEEILGRADPDPRLHVNVTVHVDELVMRGADAREVAGGALLRTDQWAPRVDTHALCATTTAVEGITSFDVVPLAEASERGPISSKLVSLVRRPAPRGIA